jgi:tetratricopeptide (TPR) repeat protein
VAALGLHNLVDFSLELPAISFCAALVLGALSRPDEQGHAPGLYAGRPAVAALVLAALGTFAAWSARDDVRAAERQVRALLEARAAPGVLDAAVLPLLAAHPADAVLPAAAAWRHAAAADGDPARALAWANRALYLDPWNAAAHHAAARALRRAGRTSQSFLEYRLALQAFRGREDGHVREELLALARTPADWIAACPRTAEALDGLSYALVVRGRGAEAEGLLDALLAELPPGRELAPLYGRLAGLRAQRGDLEGAAAVLARAEELVPGSPELLQQRARLLVTAGKRAEAVALLEEAVRTQPGEAEFHLLLAETLVPSEPRRAEGAVARAQPFVTETAGKVRLQRVRLAAARALSSPGRALDALRSLMLLEPKSAALRYEAADLLLANGQPGQARTWLEEGAALDTPEGAAAARAARVPRL